MLREGRTSAVEVPTPETRELPQSARAKLDRAGRRKLHRGMRATCERVCRAPPAGTPRAQLKRWLMELPDTADRVRARLGWR